MAGKLASRLRGLSEAQFREAYGTEEQCRAVVEKLRWPEGLRLPLCGGSEGKWLSTRPKIQCRACRHQVSLTAGTIFHATKLPLTSWFLAMWLVATAKNGISSVELGRRLGVKQTNAWALKQKIMAVMTGRENAEAPRRPGRDDRRLPRRAPPGQARSRCRRQAALRRGGVDRRRAPAAQDQAPASQGLPQREVKKLVGRAPDLDRPPGHRRARAAGRPRPRPAWSTGPWRPAAASGRRVGRRSGGSTPRSATSRRRSPAPTAGSARNTPGATSRSFAWRHNRRFQLDSLIARLVHSAVRSAPLPYAKLVAS